MSAVNLKTTHYYGVLSRDLSNKVEAIEMNFGLDRKMNNLILTIPDPRMIEAVYWSLGDKVDVEISRYPDTPTLFLRGIVTELPFQLDRRTKRFRVTLNDYGIDIFNYLVAKLYIPDSTSVPNEAGGTTTELKAHRIIKDIINTALANGVRIYGTIAGANPTIENTTKVIDKTQVYNYTHMIDCIYQLTDFSLTGDGNYYIYVDYVVGEDKYYLYFKRKRVDIDYSLDEGKDIIDISSRRGVLNAVNILYIDAGEDPDGNTIISVVYDIESINAYGRKEKYLKKDLASGIIAENPEWSSAQVRAEVKLQVRAEGKRYLRKFARGRLILDVVLKGNNIYNVGNVIQADIPSFNWDNVRVRVTNIRQSITRAGWFTTLSLEQDEGEL